MQSLQIGPSQLYIFLNMRANFNPLSGSSWTKLYIRAPNVVRASGGIENTTNNSMADKTAGSAGIAPKTKLLDELPETLFDKLQSWCAQERIAREGVVVITIQKNFCSESGTLVIDIKDNTIFPNLPSKDLLNVGGRSVVDKRIKGFNVSYRTAQAPDRSIYDVAATDASDEPFCCFDLTPYRHRRLERDVYFEDFLGRSGSHPKVVYEVKLQVDNGPLLSTKYYTLLNGSIREVSGSFTQKVHAFKNYKCTKHNRFIGVDIYRSDDSAGSNSHTMRANTFTHRNDALFETFLDAALNKK